MDTQHNRCKLTVVMIDDLCTLDRSVYRDLINLKQISNESEVQALFLGGRSRDLKPEVFVVDVDLQHSIPSHPKIQWPESDKAIKPVGPLLALPLLHAVGGAVFKPYSSNWGDASVLPNGLVLTALSMILAHEKQSSVTIQEAYEEMTERVGTSC